MKTESVRHVVLLFIACAVLFSGFAGGAVATTNQQEAAASITNVTHTGAGIVETKNGTTYVWQADAQAVNVTFTPSADTQSYRICLSQVESGDGTTTELACRDKSTQNSAGSVSLSVANLSAQTTGPHDLKIDLYNIQSFDRKLLDTKTIPIYVMQKGGDEDDDGLTNEKEVALGLDYTASDTDQDGLTDGEEVTQYQTIANKDDSDDDGARDGIELQRGTDPLNPDSDGDGVTDGEELEVTDPLDADTDNDGLTDGEERSLGTDPTRVDTDSDGLDDATEAKTDSDPLNADTDSDGLNDGLESRLGTSLLITDTDGDGLSDQTEYSWGTDPLNGLTVWMLGTGTLLGLGGIAGLAWWQREEVIPVGAAKDSLSPAVPAEAADAGPDPEPVETDEPAIPDADLVPPDKFINQLLTQRGGQMKQTDIVDESGWSKAKVSRELSKMEENGAISRFRIGRGNIVTLSGHEPDAAKSQLED
ncbi:hypothetical protein [Haladaptatus sp. DJG-WS-42]|uniref:helix-turn-helix transcriptional regulator n=1 Tax=Haladaptatus sp. DJG-WS-42 TaxID=3120516 RepID=UPI0030CFD567